MKKGIFLILAIVGGLGLLHYLAHPVSSNSSSYTPSASAYGSDIGQHTVGAQVAAHVNSNSAPNFSLPLLSGGMVSLADFRGKQSVILDFWATWCPNCQRDMPKLSALYQQYKNQVAVVGINLRENASAVASFVNSYGIAFPIAVDTAGQMGEAYGVQYTNTHVLINTQGNIVRTIPGDITEQDFEFMARQ